VRVNPSVYGGISSAQWSCLNQFLDHDKRLGKITSLSDSSITSTCAEESVFEKEGEVVEGGALNRVERWLLCSMHPLPSSTAEYKGMASGRKLFLKGSG